MLPWLNRICALPSTRAPEFELGSEGPSIGNGGETALRHDDHNTAPGLDMLAGAGGQL